MTHLLLAADPYGYFDDAAIIVASAIFVAACGWWYR